MLPEGDVGTRHQVNCQPQSSKAFGAVLLQHQIENLQIFIKKFNSNFQQEQASIHYIPREEKKTMKEIARNDNLLKVITHVL